MPGSFTFHTQAAKPQLGLSGPSTFVKKKHLVLKLQPRRLTAPQNSPITSPP
jgi:hypothetical protein